MEKKLSYAIRPDAQAFDEIRIKTVPRYKSSELSGSEWRISSVTEFYRKGELIHSTQTSNMETSCGFAYARLVEAQDNGMGYFAGDGIHCDQEGCSNLAQFLYKLKKEYCSGGGNCGQVTQQVSDEHRCFCNVHKTRGDSSLDDRDENYELVNVIV